MATNKEITQLTELTTLTNNDLFETVDVSDTTMSPSGTNKKITAANILSAVRSSIYFSPFAAKPITFSDLQTALTFGGYIYIPSSITMTADLQLSADATILFAVGAQLIAGAYRIDYNEKSLTLTSSSDKDVVVTFTPTVVGNSLLYNAGGDSFSSILTLVNCRTTNLGTAANTPLSLNAAQIFRNASVKSGDADSAGVYITRPNSSISGLTILTSNSPASTNIIKTEDGTCVVDDLTLANIGGVSGTLANFGAFNKMSKVNPTGDSACNIIMQGSCDQLISDNDVDVNLTLNGSRTHLSNSTVNNLDASGSNNAMIIGCYGAGTYTAGTETEASGCKGSIINTQQPQYTVQAKTDESFTSIPSVIYLLTASASDLTINLPAVADLYGKYVTFRRQDANTGTLGIEIDAPTGVINGGTGFINLDGQGTTLTFYTDGTNYFTT